MSLLMQALKKADRARREALPDEDDATRPSAAFDGILALTPDDVIAGRVPPAPPAVDTQALSLEALDAAEARAMAPAGSVDEQVPALVPAIPAPHDPTPRQSRRAGDCVPRPCAQASAPARLPVPTLQDVAPALMPEPHLVSAAAPLNEVAPALGTQAIAPMRDFEATMAATAPPAHATGPAQEARQAHGAGAGAPHANAAALGTQGAAADADADAPFSRSTSASRAQGTAARARAAAQAAALQDQPGRDPARVRLAMLGGALALVAGTLGAAYWYAITAPGPGARLPPVPMPPPGAATGPAPVAVVVTAAGQTDGQGGPATSLPEATSPGASTLPAAARKPRQPAPAHTASPAARATTPAGQNGGNRMPSDDDLQRALQQQAQAATAGEPQAGARSAATPHPGNPAPPNTPWGASPATYPANPATPANPSTPAYSTNPAPLPGGTPATDIHVARGAPPQRINAALQEGYQAFMAGNDSSAARHYASVLRQEPNNRDALLGNSAIAARRNDIAAATSGYQRLLELNPDDADAQAGLLALRPGDPGQSELRLKDLLRRDPGAGPLEFALGNLYARQGRWPDAQQAYFRAYASAPENADYAFNLAVGLDHLSQRTLALTYYQRALELARTSPAAFDRSAARRRADQLAASEGGNRSGNSNRIGQHL